MISLRRTFVLFICFPWLVSSNDECGNAEVVTALPFQGSGDTSDATVDFETPSNNFRNLTCGITTTARGVWYRIEGTGSLVEAKIMDGKSATGGDNGTNTDVRFRTAIFRGNNCDDLDCLLPGQYELENQRTDPTSTWFATFGETYFFHVTGVDDQDVGPFDIEIFEHEAYLRPSNDQCDRSFLVDRGVDFIHSTEYAFPHGIENAECGLQAYSRGLFFSGIGPAVKVTLEYVEAGSDSHFEIAILSSDCSQCITFSDFITVDDAPHELDFEVNAGEEYVVVVSGESFSDYGQMKVRIDVSTGEGKPAKDKDGAHVFSGKVSFCFAMLMFLVIAL